MKNKKYTKTKRWYCYYKNHGCKHFIDNSNIKFLNIRTGSLLIFVSELNPYIEPVYENIRK